LLFLGVRSWNSPFLTGRQKAGIWSKVRKFLQKTRHYQETIKKIPALGSGEPCICDHVLLIPSRCSPVVGGGLCCWQDRPRWEMVHFEGGLSSLSLPVLQSRFLSLLPQINNHAPHLLPQHPLPGETGGLGCRNKRSGLEMVSTFSPVWQGCSIVSGQFYALLGLSGLP